MRWILYCVAAMLVFSAITSNAQISAVKYGQRSVKRALMRYAPRIYAVKFDHCQASIKSLVKTDSLSYSPTRTFPGGGFPNDEASNYFSLGPGNDASRTFVMYGIAFDKIESRSIKIGHPNSRGLVNILIASPTGNKGLFLKSGKKLTGLASITLWVRDAKANEVSEALMRLANACQ